MSEQAGRPPEGEGARRKRGAQGQATGGGRGNAPGGPGRGIAGRVLTFRLPLWLVLAMLCAVAAVFLVVLLSQDEVELGPGVDGAVDASVSLTLCNETVDRRGINPRAAELELQEGLQEAGAKQVSVKVNRIDCGPDAP